MMNEIRFWDKSDENIMINGLYTHRVDENAVDIYIQAIAREAVENGATSVTVDNQTEMKDFLLDTDENGNIEIVLFFVDTWEESEIDYLSNMHCDTYGTCGGTGCPNYFRCHA